MVSQRAGRPQPGHRTRRATLVQPEDKADPPGARGGAVHTWRDFGDGSHGWRQAVEGAVGIDNTEMNQRAVCDPAFHRTSGALVGRPSYHGRAIHRMSTWRPLARCDPFVHHLATPPSWPCDTGQVSIYRVNSATSRIYDLLGDRELDPDELARDARLLRGLALSSVFMLVAVPAILSVALRMLLSR